MEIQYLDSKDLSFSASQSIRSGRNVCKNHLTVNFWQQLEEPLLGVWRQDREGVLVDDGPQVGVDQNGVWRFHIYFTFGSP